MREILFRGKIIELCQYRRHWLEGFYGVEVIGNVYDNQELLEGDKT